MTNLKMASKVAVTVVVLGDSRVGKSALIQKFVSGEFREVRYDIIYFYLQQPAAHFEVTLCVIFSKAIIRVVLRGPL